eukprot:TRINITY_DN1262_c0_g1_i1.p1 TRINITY_DN1262_c0_g1~~TRINITY_DN1262_c0_g1_i1.p1  ORF type:complete len:132 (-),score=17.76 TRINITY_DN1262_c0_g1_i1:150-545(-)
MSSSKFLGSWLGQLSRHVREIRMNYHPNDAASAGGRKFMEERSKIIAQLNPGFPLYFRQGPGEKPNLVAFYPFGKKEVKDISNFSQEQVEQAFKELVEYGSTLPKEEPRSFFTDSIKDYDPIVPDWRHVKR